MTTKIHEQESEQIRGQILDAADLRLRTYGYGKTTMMEIASDVSMSAANLYRYFDNKLDIGAALAQRCFNERHAILREVVEREGISASEKLEAFVITNLHYTHTQYSEAPKINELVDIIVTEHCEIIQSRIENDLKLIITILESGIQNDEFSIENILNTAQAVQHAIIKFNVPLFMSMYPLNEFEQHAKNLVQLLVRGLGAR